LKKSSTGLLILLIAAVGLHLAVVAQDFATLARNGYLYDDSFYAFQIARSIAQGQGPTFDGSHLTNGFQPLYVFVLVPVFAIAGSDPIAPIYAALVLLALCTAATALLIYRIARRYASHPAALAAAALWVFSPVVMRQTANGLETALAGLCFAAAVAWYLERVRSVAPKRADLARLGLLLGLAILARVDLALLVLAMALDYLLVMRRRGEPGGYAGFVTAFAVCLGVCVPWIVYGLVAVGSPLQESGSATRFLSIAYAPLFDLGSRSLVDTGPDAEFIWGHIARSASVLKANPVTHPLFRAIQKLGLSLPAEDAALVFSRVLGATLTVVFAMWVWWRSRRSKSGELSFLLLFSVMMIAAYSAWIFGVFFFLRYYYPLFIVAAIYSALAIDDVASRVSTFSLPARRLVTAAVVLYLAAFAWMSVSSGFRSTPVYGFYDVARWVEENIDENETVGVFQSGAIGYLSGRRVVNLDGKVNREARVALQEGRLGQYLRSAGIDVVLDDMKVLDLFLGPWSKDDYRRLEKQAIYLGFRDGTPGWLGLRVPNEAVSGPGQGPAGAGGLNPSE